MEILDFYEGFEGEPEITIIQKDKENNIITKLKLWDGYFSEIINLIEPNEKGYWEGVTLLYHVDLSWLDEPWECDDVGLFLKQLESIDEKMLKEGEEGGVERASFEHLKKLKYILANALKSENTMIIERF
jgi:hypothetical protein